MRPDIYHDRSLFWKDWKEGSDYFPSVDQVLNHVRQLEEEDESVRYSIRFGGAERKINYSVSFGRREGKPDIRNSAPRPIISLPVRQEVPVCHQLSVSHGNKLSVTTASLLILNDCSTVPPPGISIRKNLESCLVTLRKGANDQMLVTGKDLETSLRRVRVFLQQVIRSKGRYGDSSKSSPLLYVCGATGCGKSMGVDMCCSEEIKRATAVIQEWETPPEICYLNSSLLQKHTEKEARVFTYQRMGVSTNRLRRSPTGLDAGRSAIILILDEVDLLISSKGTEGYLRSLLALASNKNTFLSVIGIANSVDNEKARRLNDLGFVSFYLIFCT